MNETIKKVDGKWHLFSKKGKILGVYDSEESAKRREREIQYFKLQKEDELTLHDLQVIDPTDGSWKDDFIGYVSRQYKKRNIRDAEESTLPKFIIYKSLKDKKIYKEAPLDAKKKNGEIIYIMPGGELVDSTQVKEVIENIEEIDTPLVEALTAIQRIKRRALMRKSKAAIARGRKRAARRKPTIKVMKNRALKAARNLLAKKLAGGRSKAELSFAERNRIEKVLAKKQSKIKAIARKILPKLIKKEKEKQAKKAQSK